MIKFYDTCSILLAQDKVLEDFFYISDITIKELEHIKTAYNKDEEIKARARALVRLLENNKGTFQVLPYMSDCDDLINSFRLPITNDNQIIACYKFWIEDRTVLTTFSKDCNDISNNILLQGTIPFVTNDLACKAIAKNVFCLKRVDSIKISTETYKGFKEVTEDDDKLAYFYEHLDENTYDLLVNQYLIVCGQPYKWTGFRNELIPWHKFTSSFFGEIKSYNGDVYQCCALDSFYCNQITLVGGPSGSGKSFLALGYLFSELEHGNIDRIVVFCNPVAARNAARLGYYKGTRTQKVMDSQVGAVLSSKLGDQLEVERLIDEGQLILIPASDARGYQTPPNSGVYILEAQNLDIELIKLMLQRIDETSKVIIDGDRHTQTDLVQYAGINNGMERVTQVFKGEDYYGQMDLQKIARSKIAEKAEEL